MLKFGSVNEGPLSAIPKIYSVAKIVISQH